MTRSAEGPHAAAADLSHRIAHDVNSLLNGIVTTVSLCERDAIDPRSARRHVVAASERARVLVERLLRPHRDVESRDFEVRPVVEMLRPSLESVLPHDVELDVRYSSGALLAHGEPSDLELIVFNLVTNAGEAMEGVKGRVLLSVNSSPRGAVTFTVADRGARGPEVPLSSLRRAGFTTKRRGTGLGLALASEAASRLRGALTFARVDGETRFRLSLPAPPEHS